MNDLENYLRQQIPLIESLGVKVVKCNNQLAELKAPLEPNRNHLGTVFGGSTYSVSVLACYSWLFQILKSRGLSSHVVIKSGHIKYLKPVNADFTSVCAAPEKEDYEKFILVLEKKKRSKITLRSQIRIHSLVAAEFEGEFVANL
jgi:thioesterase domain-containing protein